MRDRLEQSRAFVEELSNGLRIQIPGMGRRPPGRPLRTRQLGNGE
jgi:hypothetical protein